MAWQGQLATTIEEALTWLSAQLAVAGVQRRLRFAVLLLLVVWLARSLVLALWSFVPPAEPLPQGLLPINPVLPSDGVTTQRAVNIEALVAAQLFGDATDSALAAEIERVETTEVEAATELAGIEDGAVQSNLPLVLRGIVAVTDAGLGQAVIEHRKMQDLYRVGDELPGGNRVELAKVMPRQVVIDNGGRYELLRLFEEGSSLAATLPAASAADTSRRASRKTGSRVEEVTGNASEIAAQYRQRLYSDPQSLTELVSLSVVREGSQTIGYRLSPGPEAQAFQALGFRSGDLVTAVNGKSVAELANITGLYDDMRSAKEAVFELSRGDEQLTLTLDLGAGR
jgi:general secretion pathway protein C